MPVGSFSLTYHYCNELQRHRPKSVLDLGIGYGLQGGLVRQYLDNGVRPWKTQLMGVEGFEGYRNPQWGVYDHIYICDIKDFVNNTYELFVNRIPCGSTFLYADTRPEFIILSDVLEHFDRDEGSDLIKKLMAILPKGGVLMIGTPGVWCEQDAVHGNEYERHKSLWKWNEFPPGFEVLKNGQGDEFGHYMILVKYVKKL